ncbi:MAG: hypothetical protein ACOC4R_01985 [Bacteroidota bacterium]
MFAGVLSVFFVLLFFSSAKALLIYELFDNTNLAAVYNGPSQPTKFTIDDYYEITEIETYHWNSARGKTPGQIRIVHSDETVYGPWQATGRTGYRDVPNAYWQVHPYEAIKPGTYTIQVSDNDSWSYNSQSENRGHAKVYGILSTGGSELSDSDIIFNFVEDLDLGEPIFVPRRQQTQCVYADGYELCYRQYNNYYGYPLFLATHKGRFLLYFGDLADLGTVQEWLALAGHSVQPQGLDGTWKIENNDLTVEIRGDKAYFVSFGSTNFQTMASQGMLSIGDLKMKNITKIADNQWSLNDLWWWQSGGQHKTAWSDKSKSTITMSQDGNTLTVKGECVSPFNNSRSTGSYTLTRQ